MSNATRKLKNAATRSGTSKPELAGTLQPPPAGTVKPEPASAVNTSPASSTNPAPAIAAPAATIKVAKPTPSRISLELVKPEAKQVCVAGSFNGWKPDKTPLVRLGNGRWVGDVAVKPGRHEYLFVVDGQWQPDPNAKESVQNPFGGRNSVLTVSE
jgi:hypothetical protein